MALGLDKPCLTNQANRLRADGAQAPPASGPVEREVRRLYRTVWSYHSGLLMFCANEENMMLKLILVLSSALMLMSTECSK